MYVNKKVYRVIRNKSNIAVHMVESHIQCELQFIGIHIDYTNCLEPSPILRECGVNLHCVITNNKKSVSATPTPSGPAS